MFVSVPEHLQDLLETQPFTLVCEDRLCFSVIIVGIAVDLAYGFRSPPKSEKLTPAAC